MLVGTTQLTPAALDQPSSPSNASTSSALHPAAEATPPHTAAAQQVADGPVAGTTSEAPVVTPEAYTSTEIVPDPDHPLAALQGTSASAILTTQDPTPSSSGPSEEPDWDTFSDIEI